MAFFSKKVRVSGYLLIEVQSSLVRAALVRMPSQKPVQPEHASPHVLYTAVSYVPHHSNTEQSYVTKKTLNSVKEVVKEVLYHIRTLRSQDIHFELTDIHFALSSPWILAQSKIIVREYAKPVEVTHDQIVDILEKERESYAKSSAAAVTLIDEKVFDVLLNGYSVADWHGKETKHLEVRLATSMAGTRMISRFISACQHAVPPKQIRFHSALMLHSLAIGAHRKEHSPALILDIHGELTDAAVVNAHSCIFFGSFPEGVNTAVRSVSHAMRLPEQAADSLLSMSEDGKLDPAHAKSAAGVLTEIGTGWEHRLTGALSGSPMRGGSIQDVFLLGIRHEDYFKSRVLHAFPGAHVRTADDLDLGQKITLEARTEIRTATKLCIFAIGSLNAS